MFHFQDKICNIFTFIGLLAIIFGGICSICSSTPNKPEERAVTQETDSIETVQLDTLEEIPLIETPTKEIRSETEVLPNDTLPVIKEDTVSQSIDENTPIKEEDINPQPIEEEQESIDESKQTPSKEIQSIMN